jgi:hypothetical protein
MFDDKDIKKLIEAQKEVFVTKEEFEGLIDIVATKEDLNAFATKEDLNAFATKEDLNAFATKEDLNAFATKEDLNAFATKEDVTSFKDEILTGQDKIFKKLDSLLQEKTVGDEHDKKEKKILEIHNKVLKEHNILSSQEAEQITSLNFF